MPDFPRPTVDERADDRAFRSMTRALRRWLDALPGCPREHVRLVVGYGEGWRFDLSATDGIEIGAWREVATAILATMGPLTPASNRACWSMWVEAHVDELAARAFDDRLGDRWLDHVTAIYLDRLDAPAGMRLN